MQEQDTPVWLIGPPSAFMLDTDRMGLFESAIWEAVWSAIEHAGGVPNLTFVELRTVARKFPIKEMLPIAHVFGLLTSVSYACQYAGLIDEAVILGTSQEDIDCITAHFDLLRSKPIRDGDDTEKYSWAQRVIQRRQVAVRLPNYVDPYDFADFMDELHRRFEATVGPILYDPSSKVKVAVEHQEEVVSPADHSVRSPTITKLRWQKRTVDLALVLHALYTTGCIPATSERQLWEAAAQHFDFDTTAKDPAEALRQAYQQVRKGDAGKKTLDPNRLGEFIRECREAIPILSAIVGAIDSDSQQDTAP